jgi:hypothetical protein
VLTYTYCSLAPRSIHPSPRYNVPDCDFVGPVFVTSPGVNLSEPSPKVSNMTLVGQNHEASGVLWAKVGGARPPTFPCGRPPIHFPPKNTASLDLFSTWPVFVTSPGVSLSEPSPKSTATHELSLRSEAPRPAPRRLVITGRNAYRRATCNG